MLNVNFVVESLRLRGLMQSFARNVAQSNIGNMGEKQMQKDGSLAGQGRCLSCRFKRERNNFWKGGRYKGFHGYVYIYMPEHPRADKYHHRYVAEHVLVWEQAHGQPLPEGYLIHHLNGIKDDNRPENLVALLPKDHSTGTLRELLQKRIRELESQLVAMSENS